MVILSHCLRRYHHQKWNHTVLGYVQIQPAKVVYVYVAICMSIIYIYIYVYMYIASFWSIDRIWDVQTCFHMSEVFVHFPSSTPGSLHMHIYIHIYICVCIIYICIINIYIYIVHIDACFSGCELQFQCSIKPLTLRQSRGLKRSSASLSNLLLQYLQVSIIWLITFNYTSNDYCNDQPNELLALLSSFILCLWRASKYMAHCLQVQLDDFSQSASADVGSVLLKLSNLFFALQKSIYFSNFPKCVEKPSPKFPKV